jgi:hypothetical protein
MIDTNLLPAVENPDIYKPSKTLNLTKIIPRLLELLLDPSLQIGFP